MIDVTHEKERDDFSGKYQIWDNSFKYSFRLKICDVQYLRTQIETYVMLHYFSPGKCLFVFWVH